MKEYEKRKYNCRVICCPACLEVDFEVAVVDELLHAALALEPLTHL